MTTTAALQQKKYNQQGYLTALPVLNEMELREARHAFAELEREFGKNHQKIHMSTIGVQTTDVTQILKSYVKHAE